MRAPLRDATFTAGICGLLAGTAMLVCAGFLFWMMGRGLLFMPHVQEQLNESNVWDRYVPPAASWLVHLVYGGGGTAVLRAAKVVVRTSLEESQG